MGLHANSGILYLTQEDLSTLCNEIRKGASIVTIGGAIGLGTETPKKWFYRGRKIWLEQFEPRLETDDEIPDFSDHPEWRYIDFYLKIKAAQLEYRGGLEKLYDRGLKEPGVKIRYEEVIVKDTEGNPIIVDGKALTQEIMVSKEVNTAIMVKEVRTRLTMMDPKTYPGRMNKHVLEGGEKPIQLNAGPTIDWSVFSPEEMAMIAERIGPQLGLDTGTGKDKPKLESVNGGANDVIDVEHEKVEPAVVTSDRETTLQGGRGVRLLTPNDWIMMTTTEEN